MPDTKKHKTWGYLNMELAKLYDMCDSYDKLFDEIGIKNNRYNAAFQMFLDSMVAYMHMSIARFFDKRGDSWSLYSYKQLDKVRIDAIKSNYSDIIEDRHEVYAHLSKKRKHSNHRFLTTIGISRIRSLMGEIQRLLEDINVRYGYDEGYAMSWIGLETSIGNMINDLKKYDHMKALNNE